MLLDCSISTPLQNYKLLSNIITPRPIAWVSTMFPNALVNLAPFSFFSVVSVNPAIFSLCIMDKSDGSHKDTYKNILDSKLASIGMCDLAHLQQLDLSASELSYGKSEASSFDIKLEIIHSEYPPLPFGILAAFMCEFHSELHLGEHKCVLLEAKHIYINDSIYHKDLNFTPNFVGRVGRAYKLSGTAIDIKNKAQNTESKATNTQNDNGVDYEA